MTAAGAGRPEKVPEGTTTRTSAANELHLPSYEVGFEHGISRGLEIAEESWRGRMEVSTAIARMVAEAGPYADLAERRGEPERAERQRRALAAAGVMA